MFLPSVSYSNRNSSLKTNCLQRTFHLQSKGFLKILKFLLWKVRRLKKMLGYTNLDSEKGFAFFQRFLKEGGILEELEKAGIEEGNTVRMYGFDFDYYK